jgi:hypothetical protein
VFAKAPASNATFTSLMSWQESTGNKPCPSSQRDTEPTAVICGFLRRFPSRYFAVSARVPPRKAKPCQKRLRCCARSGCSTWMNATASSPKSTRAPTPTSNTELGPSHEPSSFMEHFSTLDAGGCRMGSETRLAIPHDGPPRAALTATVELAKKRPRGRTGASSRRLRSSRKVRGDLAEFSPVLGECLSGKTPRWIVTKGKLPRAQEKAPPKRAVSPSRPWKGPIGRPAAGYHRRWIVSVGFPIHSRDRGCAPRPPPRATRRRGPLARRISSTPRGADHVASCCSRVQGTPLQRGSPAHSAISLATAADRLGRLPRTAP